ncbi:hypothetical protein [Parasitella parasitica]|uniref:SAM domain-containing protein n=1 Tax=Parasitella parasitica TaxID=35722 RepID=A0A0B7NG24_9FUNG|nr:hypothetical protein [Parasitella parasitica]
MLPNEYKPRQARPMSEIINPGRFVSEADVTGNWYEDLQNYERNLDEMASATLDQNFKEEMQHVDQWYRYLTEAEKTATMYTLLQHSSQVQARFFTNLLQQMVKRDPLYSLLTPNNPDQDMQTHLAGAMAKAELEASQRLMSVLPYKTGQVISRPQTNANRRAVDRHSFALGDTEEYSRLFGTGRSSDLLNHGSNRSSYVSLLDESAAAVQAQVQAAATNARRLNSASNGRTSGRTMFNNGGRPHSVIEGDANSLFPPTAWMNSSNISSSSNHLRRQPTSVGHIGDRGSKIERPKSADISNWSLPTATTSTDSLVDRRSSGHGYPSVWGTQPSQQQQQQQSPSQQHQSSPSQKPIESDLIDFTNSMQQQQPFRRRAAVNRIPVVPETDELLRNHFLSGDIDSRSSSPFHKSNSSSTGLEHYSSYLTQTPPLPSSIPPQQQAGLHGIVDNTANLVLEDHDYASDHSEGSLMARRKSSMATAAATRVSKDKKAAEVIDMELLKDIPAWLRSLRLHKYNSIFCDCTWQEIVKMSDDELLKKGVAALGARRKMLKVFENIRAHCDANNIEY